MPHLDEGRIHAWLDGALGEDDRRATETHLTACAQCGRRVAEARGIIAASTRILTALDNVPANVVPARSASGGITASPHWGQRYGRLAAVIGFVAVGTLIVTRGLNRHELTTRPTDAVAPQREKGEPAAAAAQSGAPRLPTTPTRQPVQIGAPAPAQPPEAQLAAKARAPSAKSPPPATAAASPALPNGIREQARGLSAIDTAPAAQPMMAPQVNSARQAQSVVASALDVATPPHLVSRDTVQRDGVAVGRAVYELRPNVRVVLQTTPPAAHVSDSTDAAGDAWRLEKSPRDTLNEIRWRDAAGVDYVLSGPVSVEELRRVRMALRR
ncbi:MAG TPA: zf-HC2 domain-containing protein [Gemmatimonadaceae bacterium]|jgi:hypothetical protein